MFWLYQNFLDKSMFWLKSFEDLDTQCVAFSIKKTFMLNISRILCIKVTSISYLIFKILLSKFSFVDFVLKISRSAWPIIKEFGILSHSMFLNPHIHRRVPTIIFNLIPCHSSLISTLLIPLLKTKQQLFSIKLPSRTPIRHYLIFRSPTTHSTCLECAKKMPTESGNPLAAGNNLETSALIVLFFVNLTTDFA